MMNDNAPHFTVLSHFPNLQKKERTKTLYSESQDFLDPGLAKP